ncbi:MAG: hypothetical protein LBF59_01595 [Prevotellaceae bacterium]|nr:hypothetical protein [Prevotellaceae bacterium]
MWTSRASSKTSSKRRNETQNIASLHRTTLWSSMASICRDAIFCVSILRLLVDYSVVVWIVEDVVKNIVENVVDETQ